MKPVSFFRLCLLAPAFPLLAAAQPSVQSEQAPQGAVNSARADAKGRVDLNTADIPTLEALPEIGTDLANGVVAARPFKSVDDAGRGLKLTPQKMATLRERVWVSAPKPPTATPTGPQTTGASKPPPTKDGVAIPAKEVTERYDRAQGDKADEKKK
jgi:hypothetical protein